MIDLIVRPEGPLAVGSDRRAAIASRQGGSAANQAAWLAYFGVAVDFVGRVGAADHAAQMALLRRAGVEPWLAADPERQTGRLIALIDANGERSFLTDRAANEALCAEDIPEAVAARADLIHLSGYSFFTPTPRDAVTGLMAKAGEKIVTVDPASSAFLREAGAQNFLDWTRGAHICFPNSDEAAALTGSPDPAVQLERLAAHYPLAVVKRGALGCEAAAGERRWRAPAAQASVIDPTGAGDAFVAGFLHAKLSGAPIEACLARANAAGSAATQILGGRPDKNAQA